MTAIVPVLVAVTFGLLSIAVPSAARAGQARGTLRVLTPEVPKPLTGTIICRGGPALRWETPREMEDLSKAPSKAKRQVVGLIFQISRGPAGPQGLGLKQPSECGFVDKPWPIEYAPPVVYFDASSAEFDIRSGASGVYSRRSSIQEYLTDINHFWSFNVVLKSFYFDAETHQRFDTKSGSGLQVPILTEAGNTPGSAKAKATSQHASAAQPASGNASAAREPATAVAAAAEPAAGEPASGPAQSRVDPGAPIIKTAPLVLKPTPAQAQTGRAMADASVGQTPIQGTGAARVPADATKINTVELICRGGPSFHLGTLDPAFVPDRVGTKQGAGGETTGILQLSFVGPQADAQGRSPPAGENGTGLQPSQCSFAQQPMNLDEPKGIRFEASPAEEKTVRDALADPKSFWRFTAYKTNYGYFQTTDHGPWKPKSATQIAGVGENLAGSNATIARLTNVKVFPELGGVGFRFIARPNATPRIDLGKEAAVVETNGIASIASPVTMRADRDNRNSNEQVTIYVGSSVAQRVKLEQGKSYHYVITVPGDGSVPMQQARGSFTTLAQTVRVRLTHIRVLSLKDHDDIGQLYFTFAINPEEPTETSDSTGMLEWAPGLRPFGKELVITGDVDRLRIVVRGEDREVIVGLVGCLLPGQNLPRYDERPTTSDCGDTNVAKRELLLSSFPDFPGKPIDFTMRALPGKHGSQLAFEVNVHIEGVRPR